jgi:sulfur carrier protein ThiS
MHRGSSKDGRGLPPPTEGLPLSVSPLLVRFDVTRGGSVETREISVASGTRLRAALRAVGLSPEGCAVLLDETPVPLDTPMESAQRYTVVPTFSGG